MSQIIRRLAVVLMLPAATPVFAAGYNGFTMDPVPVLPEVETHPSLWFRAEEIPALRAKKDADGHARALWEALAASPYLTRDLPPIPDAGEAKSVIQGYYGDVSQQAMLNAFMSLMMEDEAEAGRYRARALEALERTWDGPIYDLDPKVSGSPVDEIYHGTWAQNVAAAYDWMQPSLDADADARIREKLRREAQYLHDNLYSFAPRPHNHQSKPAWGLGSLALAISGTPGAREWLGRAIESSNRNTSEFFSADGIYREGSHYYIFSLINFVPFLYHYRNVSGVDAFAAWQPAFEWPVLIRNASGWMPNIEDSYIRPFPSQLVAGAYPAARTRLHSGAPLGEILQWNFRTTDYGPFERSLQQTGFNYSGASLDYPLGLVEYLCYRPDVAATAPDVSPTVFLDSGETAFRNRWDAPGPGQRYLLFQGVAEASNHQHFEHLSFIVQAEGQMMAADAGYSRASYGEPTRIQWYRTPEAHNVITAGGEAPGDPAENVTPPSFHRIDTGFFDFEEKRAVYAAGGVHARAIAFPGEEYFVVLDRVLLPEEREMSLNLHGGRGALSGEGSPWIWTFENDTYGPEARLAAWIMAPGAAFKKKSGEITYIKGDYAEYPYVDATVRAKESPFLQVLWPAAMDSTLPVVERVEGGAWLTACVTTERWSDLVGVQLRPGEGAVAGVRTDACQFWRRTGGDGAAWSAAETTLFEPDDGRRLGFSRVVAFAAQTDRRGIALTLSCDEPVTLRYRPPEGWSVQSITGPAGVIQPGGSDEEVEVELPGPGEYRIAEEQTQ